MDYKVYPAFCVRHCMPLVVDIMQFVFIVVCMVSFFTKYMYKESRCNPLFGEQLHCLSGIIMSHKPFFGFIMHCVGGMILLSAGLRVETDKELKLAMLSMLYFSFSGVINFDVCYFKPIHFTFLFCVLVFSAAFAWLQWTRDYATAYTCVSAAFVGLIFVNYAVTKWQWPWMNIQAIAEIAWVTCLLICIIWGAPQAVIATVD